MSIIDKIQIGGSTYDIQDTATKAAVADLKSALNDITGNEKIAVTDGAYIDLSAGVGGTADINNPVTSEGSSYAVHACSEGDIFTITTHGGNRGRAYGFLNANGEILEVAPATVNYTEIILVAPANSAYVVANSNQFDMAFYAGYLLDKNVIDLRNRQSSVISVLQNDLLVNPEFTTGKSISENGTIYNNSGMSATLDFIHALKGSVICSSGYRDVIIARYSEPNIDSFIDYHAYAVRDSQTFVIDRDCYIRVASNTKNISIELIFLVFDTPLKDQLLWYGKNGISFEIGGIYASNGGEAELTNRARTGFINAVKGSQIHLRKSGYSYTVFEYYTNSSYYYSRNNVDTVWRKDDYIVTNPDVSYLRIVIKRDDNASITSSDLSFIRDYFYLDDISQNAPEICIASIPSETYKTNTVAFDGTADLTYAEIIAGYDELVTNFPDYVTKKTLGTDSSGEYTICQYVFTPSFVGKLTLNYSGKNYNDTYIPTIILEAGVHGSEKPITRALLNFVTALCNDWETDEILSYLRFNFRFVVNPCAVPWGYENTSRFNANGVNINRNFNGMDQWQYGSDVVGNPNYRGTEPLSEVEAQYIDETLKEYKDHAILYYSYHTYGLLDGNYTRMMCWAWATYVKPNELFIAGESILKKITRNAIVFHNYPKNTATNPKYIGSMQAFNTASYKGGYTANQGDSYGIPSACPEGIYYKFNDPSTRNSHDINCINAEYIVLTIMEALKQLY